MSAELPQATFSDEALTELMRSVWGPRAPEPKTPEERIARAWGEISATAGLANAAINALRAHMDAEGLSDAAQRRALAIGEAFGVETCVEDDWRDYLNRLGWVLSFIGEPDGIPHGSC